jgi:hypothetical protein
VEREVRQGGKEGEEQSGERVGEECGPQRSGSVEEADDHERRRVQRRYDPQGADPLGLWDAARVAHLAGAGQVREIDQREPARQEKAKETPQETAPSGGLRTDGEEERDCE